MNTIQRFATKRIKRRNYYCGSDKPKVAMWRHLNILRSNQKHKHISNQNLLRERMGLNDWIKLNRQHFSVQATSNANWKHEKIIQFVNAEKYEKKMILDYTSCNDSNRNFKMRAQLTHSVKWIKFIKSSLFYENCMGESRLRRRITRELLTILHQAEISASSVYTKCQDNSVQCLCEQKKEQLLSPIAGTGRLMSWKARIATLE